MSRIGKNPVVIPQGVEVQINGQLLKAKGKLGELTLNVHDDVTAKLEEVDGQKVVRLSQRVDTPMSKKVWPTMRALTSNIMTGVSKGYTKKLQLQGVGYRANLQGKDLVLALGFSHEIRQRVPDGIQLKVENQTEIEITGADKQKVGQLAANIRGYKPPEPYKGKGIRYSDEYVRRKEGKKK